MLVLISYGSVLLAQAIPQLWNVKSLQSQIWCGVLACVTLMWSLAG